MKDVHEWIAFGVSEGFCGPPVCATHDGIPSTDLEDAIFEDGDDPCITVIRPYNNIDEARDVECNHSPSIWRKGYFE